MPAKKKSPSKKSHSKKSTSKKTSHGKKRGASAWNKFVSAYIRKPEIKKLPARERFAAIARKWKKGGKDSPKSKNARKSASKKKSPKKKKTSRK